MPETTPTATTDLALPALAPLLRHAGKPGFVVTDMTDVDRFAPLDSVALPDSPLHLLTGLDRGDHMASWSPDEALPSLTAESRTPALWISGGAPPVDQPRVAKSCVHHGPLVLRLTPTPVDV